ncbi:ribonucleoside-diphosphate reductase [candidate division WOR-1 bacterium DG_54_3]|uniref:Vitamin B12-dependent ribonucleotide reductase n=1 Tax=candidate division WOR-1 bacterium DG_54_3 TaxID=1703775 RepID=A0A0S7Y4R7_UNCSA|nr:MAG: ribonucleoside-diphosphate reductase [candidate division WOR-1 bacterium DG_54_3]
MSRFSRNALTVLKKRYLLRDNKGKIVETPDQLLKRVAKTVAKSETEKKQFYEVMRNLEFLPNSPTLMNAGTDIGQLSACFVIPIHDSLESIFEAVKDMALIQQSGGGTGFSFSRLRPKGDVVKTTHGVASGPVSFMHVFDETTEIIKQGGKRRGANMGILSVNHLDILEFITSKRAGEVLRNFNISVAVTDEFMKAVRKNKKIDLINPRTKKKVRRISAKKIFDLIVDSAWRTGDPGLIFIDQINRRHSLRPLGKIEATNPCGEQPLLPYESCNLGSINLARMIKNGGLDWKKLKETARIAVHFLDNVLDVNKYPLPHIEKITKANRKIGLGVMGFAEMLIRLGIRYDTKEALELAQKVMRVIQAEGHQASIELGKKRGSFPNFIKSVWRKKRYPAMRNATVTTIAPTGSISLIAGCTSGIEPLFSLAFTKEVLGGVRLIQKYKPSRVTVTTFKIKPEWHVRMQAAFQKYTDNAVSKTINLPAKAARRDVREAFLLAHKLKCKGITVYRYGSKPKQVLYTEDSGEPCCEI